MKRGALLKHLRLHGCVLKREGRSHSLWLNPATGAVEAVQLFGRRAGLIIGGAVFSHWILDLLVHRPDLPLI